MALVWLLDGEKKFQDMFTRFDTYTNRTYGGVLGDRHINLQTLATPISWRLAAKSCIVKSC